MPENAVRDLHALGKSLKRVDPEEYGPSYQEVLFAQYQLCVEMADRISQRRQTANSFYLSIVSLLLGGFVLFGGASTDAVDAILVSLTGMILCSLWLRNIASYTDLNSGKFAIISAIEKYLPMAPYEEEWRILRRGLETKTYRPFREVEKSVPYLFMVLFLFLAVKHVDVGSLKALLQEQASKP